MKKADYQKLAQQKREISDSPTNFQTNSQNSRRRLLLEIAYDGSDYHGWQWQDGFPTIQGEIEAALEKLLGHAVNLLSCGRTDAGVHAIKQVATFSTHTEWSGEVVMRALNATLPRAIRIRSAREVVWEFHPINDVVSKRYRYLLDDQRPFSPFLRNYVWVHHKPLDEHAMAAAAKYLLGTHDFAAFQSQGSPRESTVRTIFDITVCREMQLGFFGQRATENLNGENNAHANHDESLIVIEVEADGFLYNMVRAIVGTLALIGSSHSCHRTSRAHGLSPEWIQEILTNRDRTLSGPTAPAHGLYMLDVQYPPYHKG